MLKNKSLYLSVFLVLFAFSQLLADGNTFNGVKRVSRHSMGQIVEDGQVKGYYCFFFLDKADRKNNNYELDILDGEGRMSKSIPITLPKNIYLVESAYNGEAFLFEFFDMGKSSMQYISYSKDGKQLAKRNLEKMKMWEVSAMTAKFRSENPDDNGEKAIFAAGKDGFVRYSYEKGQKLESEIEFMDNNLKVKWTWRSDANDKMMDYAAYAASNENFLTSVVMVKKGIMAKEYTNDLLCLNMKTGKQVYRTKLEDKNKYFNCTLFDMSDGTDNVTLVGEYFDEPKFLKDNSEGLFAAVVGPSGKFVNSKLLSWGTEVAKKIPINDKGKFEGKARIFFHRTIKTADGRLYIIGEQYKKVASGMGIVNAILGGGRGGASVVKIQLGNFMVFELAADFSLDKVNIFEKLKRGIEMPQGSEYMASNTVAAILKAQGAFDYEFTQVNKDRTTFSIVSIVRDENEKGKKVEVLNTLSLNSEKKFTQDKFEFKEPATTSILLPAKSGYVMFAKHYYKEKKLTFNLEKINVE